jgi:hypothetical protein
MRFDAVAHWLGKPLPAYLVEHMADDIPMKEIEALARVHDIAIMHQRQPQPTRRQQRQGAKYVEDKVTLWVDDLGGKFRQR